MKRSIGCIALITGIFIIVFVSTSIADIINDWIKPYVSRQSFNWLSDVVIIVVCAFIGGIFDFIILPFFNKYIR